MKRRQFILAAAVASLYAPGVLGGVKALNHFQYFNLIGAMPTSVAQYSSLITYLNKEAKSLQEIGYKQTGQAYIYSESFNKETFFIPYSLTVNSEVLDSQYIVIQTTDFQDFQKVAILSLDFLKAVNLATASLKKDYSPQELKNLLLPQAGKRTEPSQLFITKEGNVSYVLKVFSDSRENLLTINTDLQKVSFSFKTDNEALVS